MPIDKLSVLDALESFATDQRLSAALFLTFSFDGSWFEKAVTPELFDRAREERNVLVLRDPNAVIRDIPSVRWVQAETDGTYLFHPKLALYVAEDRARAIIGSANLTQGGFARNLELGSVFDIDPAGGFRSLFETLLGYISGPLHGAVGSESKKSVVRNIEAALRKVVENTPKEKDASPHVLLHNDKQPLWHHLLAELPHKVLRRAAILSPFYETDDPENRKEDPPGQADDTSAFRRLFDDFTFEPVSATAPVAIYCECSQAEGETALPVAKLKEWKDQLHLYIRSAVSTDARRLHGKLLILEGAEGKGRKPFLYALHGSPNFTAAALLKTPSSGGNAELAVLTRLPPRSNGLDKVAECLGFKELFVHLPDWSSLRWKAPSSPIPLRDSTAFILSDATLQMEGLILEMSVRNLPADAKRYRLMVDASPNSVPVAEGVLPEGDPLRIPVPQIVDADAKVLTLRGSRVWLEILAEDGMSLAKANAPLNVDCPEKFLGRAMVGPLLQTLDQRIAWAGTGIVMTYREQQRWLESLGPKGEGAGPVSATHQADLDKFFRNLHMGFKGLCRRLEASPRSEFTLRNTLGKFAVWCNEAVTNGQDGDKGNSASVECRIYLLDRLARATQSALELAQENVTAAALPKMVVELKLNHAMGTALDWLQKAPPETTVYVRSTVKRFKDLKQQTDRLGRET